MAWGSLVAGACAGEVLVWALAGAAVFAGVLSATATLTGVLDGGLVGGVADLVRGHVLWTALEDGGELLAVSATLAYVVASARCG